MARRDTLRVGISCFPSVGGSGTLATALGMELADRGHEVHFICYERPFRLSMDGPRLHFHPVAVNDYDVLKFPDYTLPLSVRMAEVSRDHRLDLLHVHYAVPHATAAILARSMLPPEQQPRVVTTLHGTDTTLLGHDPGYAPAIRHALLSDDLAPMAIDALVHIPSREAQLDLANLAVAPDRPIPLRTQAAAALVEHIQAYGKFVTGPQADAIANTAASVEDPELRARLQAAQGVLRTDAKSTGERLKQYVPRPVAAKEEMPPKEKEEPKEKGDEKKE